MGIFVYNGGADVSAWQSANDFASTGSGGAGGDGGFSVGSPGGDGALGTATGLIELTP